MSAVHSITRFAEKWHLPVGCSFRRQMLFDHLHPNYAGDVGIGINPAARRPLKEADVLLLVGGRFGEMPSSGYTLMDSPYPKQTLIHVHPDADELGRVYRPSLAINSAPDMFAEAVEHLAPPSHVGGRRNRAVHPISPGRRRRKPAPARCPWGQSCLFSKVLPEDAIMTNGAGNYATWQHRFHRFRRFGTQAAPTSGSMGYGFRRGRSQAAFPGRRWSCFAGDGCFLMNGQDFATAVKYNLPIIVLVINNNIYGTIRMHQEREYPGRVSATDLTNPDFAVLARAYGGHGETVEATAEFAPALGTGAQAASRRSSRSGSIPRRSRRRAP